MGIINALRQWSDSTYWALTHRAQTISSRRIYLPARAHAGLTLQPMNRLFLKKMPIRRLLDLCLR
ncbi:MAG: hypothetical protein EB015_13720 [Methylocystaceae bacterium]|nr:hypothetical protein [Methylocystaceae bacterium]